MEIRALKKQISSTTPHTGTVFNATHLSRGGGDLLWLVHNSSKTANDRGRGCLWRESFKRLAETSRSINFMKIWFINRDDNVNWPPYRDWTADVSSVSPSSERRVNARNVSFSNSVRWSIYMINSVDKPNFRVSLPHRRSTTVSSETIPFTHKFHGRLIPTKHRCIAQSESSILKRAKKLPGYSKNEQIVSESYTGLEIIFG